MKINTSYAITSQQTLSLYDDGVGFVFKNKKIDFDFKYVATENALTLIFNDDASWATLNLHKEMLVGTLFSYLHQPKELQWHLLECEFISKPKAKNALQAVRFHDVDAFVSFKGEINYSEMLIEAATCGHVEMLRLCLEKGASLHVEIESFTEHENEACFALTKAIQYGHIEIVKELLKEKVNLAPRAFDISRDNFYQTCFLYQSRPDIATKMIDLLIEYGVDFSTMSAYYLTAVMFTFSQGPLSVAIEDVCMLEKLIDAGALLDAYLLIQAGEEDTAFMFAAHMGLLAPMKLLEEKGADIFKGFEGIDALQRASFATLHDPQMPKQGSLEIQDYLLNLGFKEKKELLKDEKRVEETTQEDEKEPVSSLESLFDLKK